jgi:hypothetical protein
VLVIFNVRVVDSGSSKKQVPRKHLSIHAETKGELFGGCAPLLTVTSDQGSTLFAACVHLSVHCGLRLVWFPDVNHQEHNVEGAVLQAAGLSQINEKVRFLSKLARGPQRSPGHWFGQLNWAFKVGPSLQ